MKILAALVLCYLLGSIPSAYLLGKAFFNLDIREHGTGNMGTMNTRLIMGWLPAAVVFIVDCGKGMAAVWIAGWLGVDALLGVVSAVIGHIWPLWLRFSGGKGLATSLGGLLFSGQALTIAVFIAAWLLIYALYRQGDPASLGGGIAIALYALITGPFIWLTVLGGVIAGKHLLTWRCCPQA
ncbi:MAG: glycerol-3-phosphate acyltransferase [Syntrophomonadaceae bacterium]|jgi:glycerol-3-phosphate acyltransferase PlsY